MKTKNKLSNLAKINFEKYEKAELQKQPKQIFADAFKINFYSTLYDFLTNENELDETSRQYLCGLGENILDLLYEEFIDKEFTSINTWGQIMDFIEECQGEAYEL